MQTGRYSDQLSGDFTVSGFSLITIYLRPVSIYLQIDFPLQIEDGGQILIIFHDFSPGRQYFYWISELSINIIFAKADIYKMIFPSK